MIHTGHNRWSRSLQLGVGVACALIGAEALVVPSRFVPGVLLPNGAVLISAAIWGLMFIAIGACLSAIGVLEVRLRAVRAVSACAALLLGLVGVLRAMALAWPDATLYGCAALAIAGAAFLPVSVTRAPLQMLQRLGPVGMVLRIAIGVGLIGFGLATSAAHHDWAATALYVSLGLTLVVGLRLSPRQSLYFASVRVRLVLMTVIMTSGSLILATLALAKNAESTAIADVLSDQRLTVGEITHNLIQADSDYRGLVKTVGSRTGLAQLNPDQQRAILLGLTATNVYAFSTYDADGRALARSDDRALQPLPADVVARLEQSDAAGSALSTVPGTDRPALVFAAPYASSGGATAGYIAAEISLDQLNQALGNVASVGRDGTSVFVLDADGGLLLHPLPASADAAAAPPNVRPDNSGQPSGTLRYRANGLGYLGAYADIPSLRWSVISTFPVSYALTGTRTGREWAFGLLVAATGLSTMFGLFLADRVIEPLNVLGNAMEDLAAETTASPLPRSSLAEVQRLTDLFGTMRERLMVRTQERAHALDSAREAIRVREEFMSIAAHELKTPVTAARGHAQLLLSHIRRGDHVESARLRDSLERINAQSQKLARLIEQLLDVARLERGALHIQPRQLDLRDLVAEVLADRPERDRIVVRVMDAPVVVNADAGRLEQVLANLLDNAVKFSPDDGQIDIELSVPTSSTVRLMVRDRGLGIPLEHRAQIFDRFHQAHADSHRSGFGLGLYIAKQIVDRHAGTINVECPASGGTRVLVDLPRGGAAGAQVHQAA